MMGRSPFHYYVSHARTQPFRDSFQFDFDHPAVRLGALSSVLAKSAQPTCSGHPVQAVRLFYSLLLCTGTNKMMMFTMKTLHGLQLQYIL